MLAHALSLKAGSASAVSVWARQSLSAGSLTAGGPGSLPPFTGLPFHDTRSTPGAGTSSGGAALVAAGRLAGLAVAADEAAVVAVADGRREVRLGGRVDQALAADVRCRQEHLGVLAPDLDLLAGVLWDRGVVAVRQRQRER